MSFPEDLSRHRMICCGWWTRVCRCGGCGGLGDSSARVRDAPGRARDGGPKTVVTAEHHRRVLAGFDAAGRTVPRTRRA